MSDIFKSDTIKSVFSSDSFSNGKTLKISLDDAGDRGGRQDRREEDQGRESGPEAPLEASNEALPFALGGPFALIDHTGSLRSREDFNGQFHIIYFGYTECPYTCSTAATNIAVVLDELADGGHDLGALFITIDPTYDSPERLAVYVAKIHPKLIGLTGEVEEIERVQKSFRVHAQEAADKGGFERLYDHQPLAFLMGPSGDILTFAANSNAAKAWFRNDPRVKALLAKEGKLGLGPGVLPAE